MLSNNNLSPPRGVFIPSELVVFIYLSFLCRLVKAALETAGKLAAIIERNKIHLPAYAGELLDFTIEHGYSNVNFGGYGREYSHLTWYRPEMLFFRVQYVLQNHFSFFGIHIETVPALAAI